MPIDGDGREGFLLGQHMVERMTHLGEFGCAEIGLAPYRRKARSEQQRIVLAQGNVEGRRQAEDHVAARRGAAEFEEAQVPLRDVGASRKIELRPSPALPPLAKPRGKAVLARHVYLPRSCDDEDCGEDGTSHWGTTGGEVGRQSRGDS